MNRTIIININSIVFHIEEDAYVILQDYIAEIKKHFGETEDSQEILQDIENRIAEMFSERIQAGKKEVITSKDVDEVITQMGRVSDFEELEGGFSGPQQEDDKEEYKSSSRNKKLLRNLDDKVLGGVCSGLGYYFGIETVWIRIIFVLVFLFGGSGILVYLVLWVLMPAAKTRADRMAMRGEEPNLQNMMKDFKEEFKSYNEGFNKMTGQLAKGAGKLGPMLNSFFKFLGRAFATLMLFVCAMVLVGMLIGLVGFAIGVLGYQDTMVFPGLEVFSKGQSLLALLAGILAITIPFIALFYIFFRIVFRTGSMNTYLSLSLWAAWILSLILVVFYVIVGIQEFKEKGTISFERQLEREEVYRFSVNDIRVVKAFTEEAGDNNKRFIRIETDVKDLNANLKRDISIHFEYLDSLENPFILYKYSAKGRNRQAATERASDINYLAVQHGEQIVFDSHFSLPNRDVFRDQSVSATVYLPLGSKVVVDENLRGKMWGLAFNACKDSYGAEEKRRETEWIMRRSGLACVPNFGEQRNNINIDTNID